MGLKPSAASAAKAAERDRIGPEQSGPFFLPPRGLVTKPGQTRQHIWTPWGISDSAEQIAGGITFYSTPSHGGFHLSPERMQAMPEHLRACSYTKNESFEEDCSWCAVALAFPEYFSKEEKQAPLWTYEAVHRGKVEVQCVEANAAQGIKA
jgi:hypothetical protein